MGALDGPYRLADLARDKDNARLDEMGYRAYRMEYVIALRSRLQTAEQRVTELEGLLWEWLSASSRGINGACECVRSRHDPHWPDCIVTRTEAALSPAPDKEGGEG